MRIVGGEFRGRPLATPRSSAIRPTTDRTREAVFNVLAHRLGVIDPPDQQVYATVKEKAEVLDAVLLVNTGKVGAFNRAQRGYFNTLEYVPFVLAYALLLGPLLPRLTFFLAATNAVGRVIFAVGYSRSGLLRLPGFLISMIALALMEVGVTLSALIGLKLVPTKLLFPFWTW